MLRFSLARVLAVVVDGQAAFLTVTLATLGLALGGILTYALDLRSAGVYTRLGVLMISTCGLGLVSLLAIISPGVGLGTWPVWILFIACCLPFVSTGIVLGTAVTLGIERMGSVCAFALLGAAGGTIGLVSLLHAVGGPNTALAASVVYAAAGAIWFSLEGRRIGRILGVSVGLFFTLLVMVNSGYHLIDVRYAKGQKLAEKSFVKWNSFSRVSMVGGKDGSTMILVDGEPRTSIAGPDALRRHGPGIAALLHPGAKTLVIEPGGGLQVAQALASGSLDVTAVELNAHIGKAIMQQRFADLSQRLYSRPEVHVYVEDGLSFLRRHTEKYQVIQVNRPVATAGAFREYLSHLTADGILLVAQGDSGPMLPVAKAALEVLGLAEPERHLLFAEETLVASREPLSLLGIVKVHQRYPNRHVEWPATWKDPSALIVSGAAVLLLLFGMLFRSTGGARIFAPWLVLMGVAGIVSTAFLIQTFTEYLGHPTYGLTVALFILLLSGATGSLLSEKLPAGQRPVFLLLTLLAGAAGLMAAGAFLLHPLLMLAASVPLAVKLLVTFAIIGPLGVVLGLPLPAGLRLLASRDLSSVPGMWSLWVAAGVLGSVAAVWF